MDRLNKYSNFTCRFTSTDGKVMYSKGYMIKYPIDEGKPNSVNCKSPRWSL